MAIGSMILSEGTMLAGYRVKDVIGIGGMAIVYRAEQVSLGREVALKVLSPALSVDDAFRERFRREGRSIAALDHPNIVSIFDSGEMDGRLFLAMRLVRGRTLADRMRADGVSGEETIAILRPIAGALDAAHDAGIIHRDIKPQNILISSSGHPYLADFGIAKGTTTAGFTAAGGFVGSANYAAPEQILGQTVTATVDVYGLAVVVFQCLTGQVPYPLDTDAGVLHAQVNAPPPSIPSDQPGGDRFNAMIANGMAKAPEARLRSAGALIALAADVIDSLPVPMRRLSPTFQRATEPTVAAPSDRSTVAEPGPVAEGRSRALAPAASGPTTSKDADGERSDQSHGDDVVDAARSAGDAPAPSARGRHLRVLGTAGALILAAVVVGVGLVASGTGGAQKRTARSGPLSVTYPSRWRRQPTSAQIRSLFKGVPIQLRYGTVELAAGELQKSAAVPGDLPSALMTDFGTPIRGSRTIVGRHPGREYQWSTSSGLFGVFVLPLATGDAAIVCRGAGTVGQCAALARDAAVNASEVLPLGPDMPLARTIVRAVAPVVAAHQRLGSLSEPTLAARAAAATRLATVDRAAASRLAVANVPARYRKPVARLRLALLAEATTLSRLARDGQAGRVSAYAAAISGADSASQSLSAATGALQSESLMATTVSAFRLARPPAPPTVVTSTSSTPATTNPPPTPTPPPTTTATTTTSTTTSTPITTGPGL
jgi:serine/threonine protein kinase